MPGIGSFAGVAEPAGRLRRIAQESDLRRLRHARQLCGTRRNDSQRRYLLRNRSERGGSVGHSGFEIPFQMDRRRTSSRCEHMEQTFTDLIETMGGQVTRSTRTPAEKISTGGEIIHEVGTIRMGDDPKTSVLNKILPGARREESVCGGWRAVCQQSGQESDVDHLRAGVADGGISGGRNEEGKCLRSGGENVLAGIAALRPWPGRLDCAVGAACS